MWDLSFTALVIPWISPNDKLKNLIYSAKIYRGKVFILEEKVLIIKWINSNNE